MCFAYMVDLKAVLSYIKVLPYYATELFKNLHLGPLFHALGATKELYMSECGELKYSVDTVLALGCFLHES